MAVARRISQIGHEKVSMQAILVHRQFQPFIGGDPYREPSFCSTTITSMAPLSVAGLIEFHVLDTDPPRLRTYCMSSSSHNDENVLRY